MLRIEKQDTIRRIFDIRIYYRNGIDSSRHIEKYIYLAHIDYIAHSAQVIKTMSEDNTQKTVSEETIASIVDAATHIAEDSDAMRKNLIAVAEALQPMIERAGIRFGSLEDDQMWTAGSYPDQVTCRIGIRKYDGRMKLGVEESQYCHGAWANYWIEHSHPFEESAFDHGKARILSFSSVSREDITQAIERLPAFLDAYAAELKRRHQRYADLRRKAEQIRAVLEG